MISLIQLNEGYTNGYNIEVLDVTTFIAIFCGILVIVNKNPIVSVLFLIGLFLSIASYLISLGISFIGISYLLVYVGAVSILFLFILMLINVRISELLTNTSNSIPLAIFISISFYSSVYPRLPYNIAFFYGFIEDSWDILNDLWRLIPSETLSISLKVSSPELDNGQIYFVTSQIWDSSLAEISHIVSIGNIIYTSYSIWLILTSIILLLAMVGVIAIVGKDPSKSSSVKAKEAVVEPFRGVLSTATSSQSKHLKGVRTFHTFARQSKNETLGGTEEDLKLRGAAPSP